MIHSTFGWEVMVELRMLILTIEGSRDHQHPEGDAFGSVSKKSIRIIFNLSILVFTLY
jgi:hypothetical protein